VVDAPPEPDVLAIGRDLAAALPGSSRHPLKALDDRAMDLASQDAELRAAQSELALDVFQLALRGKHAAPDQSVGLMEIE